MKMRLIKIINTTRICIVASAICLTFNSCLKDNTPPPLYSWSVPSIVSFQDNGGASGGGAGYGSTTTPYPLYQFPLTSTNDTAGFAAIVVYGPNGPAPEDITVNLAVDTAGLIAFNTAQGLYLAGAIPFIAPDPSTYSFPASVTIPKGQTQGYARVTVNVNATPIAGANYAIPLMITSASYGTVSANFNVEINYFTIQ
jgi:hypothetical protein